MNSPSDDAIEPLRWPESDEPEDRDPRSEDDGTRAAWFRRKVRQIVMASLGSQMQG